MKAVGHGAHSVLIGAADALIRVGRQRASRYLEVEKMRDASDSVPRIHFELCPAKSPQTEAAASAYVVEHRIETVQESEAPSGTQKNTTLTGDAKLTLEVIKEISPESPVAETIVKQAVIRRALQASPEPISQESASKKYFRGRDALLKLGMLVRDTTKHTVHCVG